MSLSITIGEGKNRPQGKLLQLESASVEALAQALEEQPSRFERWWSTHTWERNYRNGSKWLASCGIGVDVDHHSDAGEHCAPPAELAQQLEDLVRTGAVPGNLFHRTPRGARVVFAFSEAARDRAQFVLACRAAGALVAAALAEHELFAFQVDQGALEDLARLLYTPRSVVGGAAREAVVVRMRLEPYSAAELAAQAPAPAPAEPPPAKPAAPARTRGRSAVSLDDAIARFNTDHPLDAPRSDGDCPVCGHRGCFGRFPDDLERWACFSTNHDRVGIRGEKCWHGDALDLAAHSAGVERVELLRREGYLPARAPRPPPPAAPPSNWVEQEVANQLGEQPAAAAASREPGDDVDQADGAAAKVLTLPRELPVIRLAAEEHELNAAAISAIATHPKVFQRTGQLVRVTRDAGVGRGMNRPANSPTISALPSSVLRSHLTEVARFERWLKTEDRYVPDHPWDWLVRAVHEFGEWPEVRHLEAVAESPVLRPDGTLIDQPGYDASTGVLYEPNCAVPLVPSHPTREQAQSAAAELLDLVCDFPFATDAHRSAWVAGLLTPLARLAISSPAPLAAVDANVRGAGKSKLVDCISVIVTGRPMARMVYSAEDEEMRKRILSIAIAGDRMVLMDNIVGNFGGPALDAALTGLEITDRLLGTARTIRVPLLATWYATGNNLQMIGDLARRTLAIRLESPEENPEERRGFKYADILEHAARERPRYLAAALTILRAFCAAGRPSQGLKPWGSFESWSELIRDAIVWAGLHDPGETRATLSAGSDVEAGGLAALLAGWRELDPRGVGITVPDALERLRGDVAGAARGDHEERYRTLRAAILELCPGPNGDLPSPKSLGRHLGKFRGRLVGGRALDYRTNQGLREWFVRSAGGFGAFGASAHPSSTQISLDLPPQSRGDTDTKATKGTTENVF